MTSDALHCYQQTRLAQVHRLRRLITTYADDLNPMGHRMLARDLVAVTGDYIDALSEHARRPDHFSSAPPQPAESSPEDCP